jgi:hypothetical protein
MKVLLKALVLARLPIFSFAQGKPSGDLVVRFRHLAPIFACPRPNVEISRTTHNDKFLVAFLNLTFARRDCGIGDTNVKFTPRERIENGKPDNHQYEGEIAAALQEATLATPPR